MFCALKLARIFHLSRFRGHLSKSRSNPENFKSYNEPFCCNCFIFSLPASTSEKIY